MGCVRGAAPFTGTLHQQSKPLLHPWVPLCFLWLHSEVQGVCFSQVDAQLGSHSTQLSCEKKKRNKKIPAVRRPKLASP